MTDNAAILAFPAASPADSLAYLSAKLAYYTDAWDLAVALREQVAGIVVIDTRSAEHYARGHIPGAINFPHRQMTSDSTAEFDRQTLYITYCDGIGCNGSTKGAYNMAQLGFQVKELIGGLDFWIRDRHPLALGSTSGSWPQDAALVDCGCDG